MMRSILMYEHFLFYCSMFVSFGRTFSASNWTPTLSGDTSSGSWGSCHRREVSIVERRGRDSSSWETCSRCVVLMHLIERFCFNVCKFQVLIWLFQLEGHLIFLTILTFILCIYCFLLIKIMLLTICVFLDFNRNVLVQCVSSFHKEFLWIFLNVHFYQCGSLFQNDFF